MSLWGLCVSSQFITSHKRGLLRSKSKSFRLFSLSAFREQTDFSLMTFQTFFFHRRWFSGPWPRFLDATKSYFHQRSMRATFFLLLQAFAFGNFEPRERYVTQKHYDCQPLPIIKSSKKYIYPLCAFPFTKQNCIQLLSKQGLASLLTNGMKISRNSFYRRIF